jgi:hypothetical protein
MNSERKTDEVRAFDLDLVELITRTLKNAMPLLPNHLAIRYAEHIVIALYRERYLPEHDL